MTAAEFRAWRARLGLTQARAAMELGISLSTVKAYEQGHIRKRDSDGEFIEAPIPRAIALACAALEIGPLSLQRRRSLGS